jgi:hypothetical protein
MTTKYKTYLIGEREDLRNDCGFNIHYFSFLKEKI